MSPSSHTSPGYCLFCLKSSKETVDSTAIVSKFLKLSGRFVRGSKFSHFQSATEDKLKVGKEILISCKDCESLLTSFCESYNQFKYLELHLEWRLKTPINIMKLANRVPARLKQVKRKLQETENNSVGICTLNSEFKQNQQLQTRIVHFKTFRSDFIKQCTRRLAQSYPKVLLTHSNENILPNSTSIQYQVQISDYPKKDQFPQLSPNQLLETFTAWVLSVVTIGMLISTEFANVAAKSLDSLTLDKDLEFSRFEMQQVDTESHKNISNESDIETPEIKQNFESNKIEVKHESIPECSSSEGSTYSNETSSSSDTDDEEDIKRPILKPNSIKAETSSSSNSSSEELEKMSGKTSDIKCTICKKTFATKLGLKRHILRKKCSTKATSIKTTKKEQPHATWLCSVPNCKQNLSSFANFKAHLKRHGKFPCKFCDIVKEYAPDLAIHETTEHTEKSDDETNVDISCSRCPSKFHIKPAFIDHFLETHLKLKSLTIEYCKICGAETIAPHKQKFLRYHFRDYHETKGLKSSEIYKCDLCPAYFIKPMLLYFHKIKIHYKEKCPKCKKSYARLKYLKAHIETCYPEILPMPFVCDLGKCRRPFASKAALALHKNYSLHDDSGRVYRCSKCKKEFKTPSKLKLHIQNVHQDRFLCPECGKAFKTKFWLTNHVKLHKGVDRDKWQFQCAMCGKKFWNSQRLEVHMRMHTQEKPFICQFCGNSYAHSLGLTRHVKASHKGLSSGLNDVTKS